MKLKTNSYMILSILLLLSVTIEIAQVNSFNIISKSSNFLSSSSSAEYDSFDIFDKTEEVLNSNSQDNKTQEKTQETSFLELQSEAKVESTLTLEARAALAVKKTDEIVNKLKKEIEAYAKIKKNRKPVEKKNVGVDENNDIAFIQKFSSSQYLPENVNEKLNEFRLYGY